MITTRRTDLYDHKSPPRQRAPKPEADGPLCPMTRKECLLERCAIWDDERDACALQPANLYCKIREAVTDAAVDIIKTYRRENNG